MKSCQISQEKTCVGVFFNKSAGPQNYSFIKRDSNTGFFSVNFVNYSRTPVEDLRTAGSETPVRFFKKTLFYRTSPVYTSNSFRFPTCNFSKKETRKRCFLWILQNFYEHLSTEHLRMTACCVYLWLLRSCSPLL